MNAAMTDRIDGDPTAEVVRELEERINDHDLDGVVELWDATATLVWPVGVWEGRSAIREAFDELLTALPDYRQETDLMVVDGADVVVESRSMGTFTGGPLGGFEPTGADSTLHMAKIYTVEDGLIVRGRVYYDQMEFAREMGLFPEEHSVGDRVLKTMLNAATRVRDALDVGS